MGEAILARASGGGGGGGKLTVTEMAYVRNQGAVGTVDVSDGGLYVAATDGNGFAVVYKGELTVVRSHSFVTFDVSNNNFTATIGSAYVATYMYKFEF